MTKGINLSIRISSEYHTTLQKIAQTQERKVADVVRSALRRYMEEQDKLKLKHALMYKKSSIKEMKLSTKD